MFYAGLRKTELLHTYIWDIKCNSCQQESEHELLITCDALRFGIFYPLKWWARNKEGYLKCKNCGRTSVVDENNLNLPPKVINYYNQTKIPFAYKLPTLVIFPSLLLIGYFFAFKIFSTVMSVMQPAEKKLPGKWQDDYQVYTVYFFDDKQYTAISYDSIMFGKYSLEGESFRMSLFGTENELPKRNLVKMPLTDHRNGEYTLVKKMITRNSRKFTVTILIFGEINLQNHNPMKNLGKGYWIILILNVKNSKLVMRKMYLL